MKWKHPPIIKIYEAIGAVADGRVEVLENLGRVYSSSGNKYYVVSYSRDLRAIMTNDNGSYWRGYLGYPAIAYLMKIGELSYKEDVGIILKGIKWKDINQKFNNDFDKTLDFILFKKTKKEKERLKVLVEKVEEEIRKRKLDRLGPLVKPPQGY